MDPKWHNSAQVMATGIVYMHILRSACGRNTSFALESRDAVKLTIFSYCVDGNIMKGCSISFILLMLYVFSCMHDNGDSSTGFESSLGPLYQTRLFMQSSKKFCETSLCRLMIMLDAFLLLFQQSQIKVQ